MSVPLIAIIYDGITNSVFESQFLQPLINQKKEDPERLIWLVSFESNTTIPIPESLKGSGISYVLLKKIPFLGQFFLRIAAYQLKKILSYFDQYELLARGPLAGFICLHALRKDRCVGVTIQARGLLAEEYAYTHRHEKNNLMYWVRLLRKKQLHALEKYVYSDALYANSLLTVQAVSPALANYLATTYGTLTNRVSIAEHDIPSIISLEQRNSWRVAMRTQMHIASHVQVYCYNGSIKPWQFPEGVLEFFKERYREDPTRILVILTQDKEAFESLICKFRIPSAAYRIYTVPHASVYEYLAACDVGILFREQTVVNWTSRPTKLLEYQAVGLEVVHNNTVAYGMKRYGAQENVH
jgi:hypothetical protein